MQIYKYLVEALVGDVNLRTKCYVFDLKKNIFKTTDKNVAQNKTFT